MSQTAKARRLAVAGAVLGGGLLLLPIPMFDLMLTACVQLAIVIGVTLTMHKPLHIKRQGAFVCVFALLGSAIGLGIEIFIPILGKLMVAPLFGLFWTYLIGELTLRSVSKR